jgi:hypothetical protein
MIDVDVFPSDTSWLSEPTTGVHQFGGGSSRYEVVIRIGGHLAVTLMSKVLILFVHGLAGSRNTWGNALIAGDGELQSRVDVDFFEYPTGLVRWLFSRKFADPQDVADGLTTAITTSMINTKRYCSCAQLTFASG